MKKVFVITGATGHLGSTIVRMLRRKGEEVRGLILPGQQAEDCDNVRYIKGIGEQRSKALGKPSAPETKSF